MSSDTQGTDKVPQDAGASKDAVIITSPPSWQGPFAEFSVYGEPTGAWFVRCSSCGIEVLVSDVEHATHRDGCDGIEGGIE